MTSRIHIVGTKNSGKTTLIEELVKHLAAEDYRVGTIKHTHHHHELDTPGKDSHRHRMSGSAVVGILSRSMNAVFWPPEKDAATHDDRYCSFEQMFADCDLVLVEGDMQTSACKIEVWRESLGRRPFAEQDASIAALVTDDEISLPLPVWRRSTVGTVAENLLRLVAQAKDR